jgi:hypothetical protein
MWGQWSGLRDQKLEFGVLTLAEYTYCSCQHFSDYFSQRARSLCLTLKEGAFLTCVSKKTLRARELASSRRRHREHGVGARLQRRGMYRGTSRIRNLHPLGLCRRPMPEALR